MKTVNPFLKIIFAVIIIAFLSHQSIAIDTPPDPPAGDHGSTGDLPPGGGAPLGEGIIILISLGAGYAVKKLYGMKKIELEE